MKKREMAELIFEMLGDILSGAEFRLNRSEDAFARKIPNGSQLLGLPRWDYKPAFEFSLNICIRLYAVEEIFHRFSGAPPKYHSLSYTTITRSEHFTGGSSKYRVTTAEEVASVGVVLSSVVRNKIIPFFDEHQDLQSVDKVVNVEQPGIDITLSPSGAMHSVILAHLAGNKDFERIVIKHRTDMGLTPEVDHPFNRLVNHLQTR